MFLLALIPPQTIGNLSKLHPKELKFTSISGGIKVNFSSPSGLTVDSVYTSAELAKYDNNHNCGEHICCPRMKRELQDGLSLFIPFDDRATDICGHEDNERMGLQWILRDARDCRKMLK